VNYDGYNLTQLPAGIEPRVRKYTSAEASKTQGPLKSFLHKAHHFELDLAASQDFMEMADEWLKHDGVPNAIEDPHPFEDYSFTLWLGMQSVMVETLVMKTMQNGIDVTSLINLPWGEKIPDWRAPFASRRFAFEATEQDIELQKANNIDEAAKASMLMAWHFCDIFKRLLMRPGALKIGPTSKNTIGVFKGTRTTYYGASNITIDLDAVRHLPTKGSSPSGRKLGEHDVRAHMCYSRTVQADCDHLWEGHPENTHKHARFTCPLCGGKKWTRKGGKRGDASIRVVPKKTYKVRA